MSAKHDGHCILTGVCPNTYVPPCRVALASVVIGYEGGKLLYGGCGS